MGVVRTSPTHTVRYGVGSVESVLPKIGDVSSIRVFLMYMTRSIVRDMKIRPLFGRSPLLRVPGGI